jgi:hypothetical protein
MGGPVCPWCVHALYALVQEHLGDLTGTHCFRRSILAAVPEARLADLAGGDKRNAIPREAEVWQLPMLLGSPIAIQRLIASNNNVV